MSNHITAVEVVRDSDGYWIHPGLPDFDEDAGAYNEWLKAQSLETSFVWLESERDDHPAFISYFKNEDLNISAWEPTPPDGDGWFLICISDTDEGPAACYARRVDLPAVIASVPRPEPVSNNAISQLLCAVQYYGSCKWSEGMGLIADPTLADVRAAWDGVYESVQSLYAEAVAAQVAVPEQWQAVARECVSHLDDGRTQPALSRSLRKLSAMLDSSVAPPVSVSHGWKLVPVEPTPGMLMAAGAAVHAATYWHRAYCAMLAATPEAPQPDDDDFELTCPEPPARDDRKAIKRLSDAVSEICFQSGESEDEFTKWLADGCTVTPQFDGTWVAQIQPCQCEQEQKGGA